jgi:hypothetical protein
MMIARATRICFFSCLAISAVFAQPIPGAADLDAVLLDGGCEFDDVPHCLLVDNDHG